MLPCTLTLFALIILAIILVAVMLQASIVEALIFKHIIRSAIILLAKMLELTSKSNKNITFKYTPFSSNEYVFVFQHSIFQFLPIYKTF